MINLLALIILLVNASPTSVIIPASFQSEVGCPGDWDPGCAITGLTYDATDDVWQGSFAIPAGNYAYNAALNGSWAIFYGQHGVAAGPSIALNLPASRIVKFYYDDKSHWITDNVNDRIINAPGSYQSELGCPGDWQPDCLRTWLEDVDGDGIYTFMTKNIPGGYYEFKVAIGESWTENYGAGGFPGGANIGFTVPPGGAPVLIRFISGSKLPEVFVLQRSYYLPLISR
jgi:hypothetical protein